MVLMFILVASVLVLVGGLKAIRGFQLPPVQGPDAGNWKRLESALESMESRLDSLEDQQRFLERLLEERPRTSLPGAGETEDSILFDTREDAES